MVYVCRDRDVECGDYSGNWCLGCPKRSMAQIAVAPHAAAGIHPPAMRPATAQEAMSVFIGKVPNLWPVIQWLEGGCDPAWAAKELRAYAAQLGQVEPAAAGVEGLKR